MTAPTAFGRSEHTSLTNLVREANRLELDVPEHVETEMAVYETLTRRPALVAQRDLSAAHQRLQLADGKALDKALDDLLQASVRSFAVRGVAGILDETALSRLRNVIFDAVPALEAQVVEKFNDAVEAHGLNESAELPNLTSVVSPVDLSDEQAESLRVWRRGVNELHPLWSLYRRLADLVGTELGPAPADAVATNMFTACVLGTPQTFTDASNAAVVFAGISSSDAGRAYGQLSPFAVAPICGFRLELASLEDAAERRRAIQPVRVSA